MQRTDPLEIADMLRHAVELSDMGEKLPEATRERMLRAANEMTQPVSAKEIMELCQYADGFRAIAREQASKAAASGEN